MRGFGDSLQTLRAHQRHVDRCRGDEQSLVGTDVRRSLGAANVLLTGLKGERETFLATEIDGAADDAAWHLTHVFHASGDEAEIRAAGGHRHTQRLAFTNGNVDTTGAPFPWRL